MMRGHRSVIDLHSVAARYSSDRAGVNLRPRCEAIMRALASLLCDAMSWLQLGHAASLFFAEAQFEVELELARPALLSTPEQLQDSSRRIVVLKRKTADKETAE